MPVPLLPVAAYFTWRGEHLIENVVVATRDAESVTPTWTVNLPFSVGIPEMTPNSPFAADVRFNPAGNVPLLHEMYGGVPPVAINKAM